MSGLDIANKVEVVQWMVPTQRAVATATLSAAIDLTGSAYRNLRGNGVVIVAVKNVSGTGSPTTDVKLQESATTGGTYTDITGAAITQVTSTNSSVTAIAFNFDRVNRFIKILDDVAGTSPVANISVTAVAYEAGTRGTVS